LVFYLQYLAAFVPHAFVYDVPVAIQLFALAVTDPILKMTIVDLEVGLCVILAASAVPIVILVLSLVDENLIKVKFSPVAVSFVIPNLGQDCPLADWARGLHFTLGTLI
jgi:hypothetical protein